MNTTTLGRRAEQLVTNQLLAHDFKLVAENWRTRSCEIDIIVKKEATIHFIEVKYRNDHHYGYGEEYVTPAKLRQMRYAAELWVSINKWSGEYVLGVAGVTGDGDIVMYELT